MPRPKRTEPLENELTGEDLDVLIAITTSLEGNDFEAVSLPNKWTLVKTSVWVDMLEELGGEQI